MKLRNANLLADLFVAAVIISVAIALAGVSWRIFALFQQRSLQLTPANTATTQPRSVDIGPILLLAPFGKQNSHDALPTALPIELRGIFLTLPRERSTALIAPTGGVATPYHVGQTLPSGGAIDAISLDSVMLIVNGHRESLGFPKTTSQATVPAGTAVTPAATSTSAPPIGGALMGSSPAPSSQAPQALLDSLGASPVSGGYRISESLSGAARQAGLLPGDVIDQVNGTVLGNPAMDRQILVAAARTGQLRIGLTRNGRRATITMPFQ